MASLNWFIQVHMLTCNNDLRHQWNGFFLISILIYQFEFSIGLSVRNLRTYKYGSSVKYDLSQIMSKMAHSCILIAGKRTLRKALLRAYGFWGRNGRAQFCWQINKCALGSERKYPVAVNKFEPGLKDGNWSLIYRVNLKSLPTCITNLHISTNKSIHLN